MEAEKKAFMSDLAKGSERKNMIKSTFIFPQGSGSRREKLKGGNNARTFVVIVSL